MTDPKKDLSMTLYQMKEQMAHFVKLLAEIEGDGAEAPPEIVHALNELQMAENEKLAGITIIGKNYDRMIEDIDEEILVLKARRIRFNSRLQWLKNYVLFCRAGSNWTNGVQGITFRKSAETVIDDMGQVPKEFQREKTVREADKLGIKASWTQKPPVPVPGTHIENKVNVKFE